MSNQHHLQMTLENDPNMIAEAAQRVAELARQQGKFSEREEFQVFLSVAEAISNAIVHGNLEVSSQLREESDAFEQTITSRQQKDPFRSRTVEVRCCVEAGALSIEIENDGPGFDASKVEDPTKWENLDKPSGRGLHIMRTYFDQVRFNEKGTILALVKTSSEHQVLRQQESAPHEVSAPHPMSSSLAATVE